MGTKRVVAVVVVMLACHVASAIDFKKNTISAGASTAQSTFSSFSSSTSINGSNTTMVTSGGLPSRLEFGDFDWGGEAFGRKTLDQRIRSAEQKLNKLYFIRDVCRTLEDEIKISFKQKDIREVMQQVSDTIGVELPYTVPEGSFLVENSDVAGMPTDQFLDSVASVCGLSLTYERDKLVFEKPEKK